MQIQELNTTKPYVRVHEDIIDTECKVLVRCLNYCEKEPSFEIIFENRLDMKFISHLVNDLDLCESLISDNFIKKYKLSFPKSNQIDFSLSFISDYSGVIYYSETYNLNLHNLEMGVKEFISNKRQKEKENKVQWM